MAKKKNAPKKSAGVPGWAFAAGLAGLVAAGIWAVVSDSPALSASSAPSGSTGAPAQWVTLESRERGFRVLLPAEPRRQPDQPGEEGGVDSTWVSTAGMDVVVLRVSDCPKELCEKAPDSILTGARKGALEEWGGKLLSEQRLEVPCPKGTCPGLRFEATGPLGRHFSGNYAISGQKVYVLMVAEGSSSREIFKKVVESFSFL